MKPLFPVRCQVRTLSEDAKILLSVLRKASRLSNTCITKVKSLLSMAWPHLSERYARARYAAALAELEDAGLVFREARFDAFGVQLENAFRLRAFGRPRFVLQNRDNSTPFKDPDPDLSSSLDLPTLRRSCAARVVKGSRKASQAMTLGALRTTASGDVLCPSTPETAAGRLYEAYFTAILGRHGEDAPFDAYDAHARVFLAGLAKRLGEERACEVVVTFALAPDPFLVRIGKPLRVLHKYSSFGEYASHAPSLWNIRRAKEFLG